VGKRGHVLIGTLRDGRSVVTGLIIVTGLWAAVCLVFLVRLVSWAVKGEQECSCRGVMGAGVEFVHGPCMCYPAAEALQPQDSVW
jgi:hypothetical protein